MADGAPILLTGSTGFIGGRLLYARDKRIRELVSIELKSMNEALCTALTEVREGPGKLPSRQACFLE